MERAALCAILLASLSTQVNAKVSNPLSKWNAYLHPVAGLDVSAIDQSFEPSYGRDHFSKHYPSTNVYIGALIHRYVGIQLGYENLYRQQQIQHYPISNGVTVPVLGFFDPALPDPMNYISNAFSNGWHLNLLGLLPIACKTQLTGSVGFGRLKMYYETVPLQNPITPDSAVSVVRWASDRRTVMQLGIGLRQMITARFGMRLDATWVETSKLGASIVSPLDPDDPPPMRNYIVKPKDRRGLGQR